MPGREPHEREKDDRADALHEDLRAVGVLEEKPDHGHEADQDGQAGREPKPEGGAVRVLRERRVSIGERPPVDGREEDRRMFPTVAKMKRLE